MLKYQSGLKKEIEEISEKYDRLALKFRDSTLERDQAINS